MKDFKNIMMSTGRWVDAHWHSTDSTYTFANGSYIEFFSADNPAKLRGARRHRLYINEANNIDFQSYMELASRTKQSVTLDWNPVAPFWFHNELMNDKDVDFLTINYLDNEACPESALNFILKAKEKAATSSYWANWYKVYGLGEIGTLEGVVFNNWQQVEVLPSSAKLIGLGMDFGYSNDPTTLVACYKQDNQIYFDELIYQKGLLNSDIARLIKSFSLPNAVIFADSAEPKSIAEIRSYGINMVGSIKGKDSINYGISVLQENPFNVTKRSLNLIKELRSYTWEKDNTGANTNRPIDNFNHCIDAMRYLAINTLANNYQYSKMVIA